MIWCHGQPRESESRLSRAPVAATGDSTAGSSFRRARSPVAPRMTNRWGLDPRWQRSRLLPHGVTAELAAHRRQEACERTTPGRASSTVRSVLAVITGAGASRSIASLTVQRPFAGIDYPGLQVRQVRASSAEGPARSDRAARI